MTEAPEEVRFIPTPKQYTRAEAGKLNLKNFTHKHQTVPMCGHKFIAQREPRHSNCEACWFAFFNVHGEFTQAVEDAHAKGGDDMIIALKGRKFLQRFLRFMGSVAKLKMALEAKEKNNGSTQPTEGSIRHGETVTQGDLFGTTASGS